MQCRAAQLRLKCKASDVMAQSLLQFLADPTMQEQNMPLMQHSLDPLEKVHPWKCPIKVVLSQRYCGTLNQS